MLMAAFLSCSFPARAQTGLSLPGCETAPEVRKILDEKLNGKVLDQMKYAQRVPYERQVLEDLIAKYPRELEPYQTLVNRMRWEAPDEFPALHDRLVRMAKDNPDDPLALLMAGWVLRGKDTLESIRLLEAARAKAPNFPWPAKELAGVYFSGKRADQNKVKENIEIFFAICPASTDGYAHWLLTKDPSLQPKVAAALRAHLEKETDPKRLRDYETLWGLEFRTRPPVEHDALRKQVAADLKRLESLNPKGDAEWQAFFINGYKQSGASKETITAMEDRLLREYPKSSQAYGIVSDRWEKAHKDPEDQTDVAAWEKHDAEYREALKGWIQDYPDDTFLQRYAWFYNLPDDNLSEKEGIAALDQFLKASADYEPLRSWTLENAAEFLTHHRWQPERAVDLMNQAYALRAKEKAHEEQNDDLSDDDAKEQAKGEVESNREFAGALLKAAKQAGKPAVVQSSLRASIEGEAPKDKDNLPGYWSNRARLASLDNHKLDALVYYQLFFLTRQEAPKAWHGRVRDDEMDEARALWKELGGTEATLAMWSKTPAGKREELAEGRWEKPTKAIPTFELSDLSGKTWRLKELGGKTLLINLWATWCGPCNAELPHVQKFYEKVKDRTDIQVLTFNIDEDLGLVAPYLKDKGYTFPVLPAYSTVVSLLDGFAIPQNWLVDPHGIWRWRQIGYGGGTDADFEKDVLDRLESTKTSQ
jgi:thiol-disulfide isomerase/thioredoxin